LIQIKRFAFQETMEVPGVYDVFLSKRSIVID
jgi:hypothetical protein